MLNVKTMTAGHANDLKCDIQGCNVTTKYTSRQGLLSHMKKKHEPVLAAGTSRQTPDIIIQDDEEAAELEADEQWLYHALDKVVEEIKGNENNKDSIEDLVDKIERLKKIVKAHNNIQKTTKKDFEEEMKKKSEVEASQMEAIQSHKKKQQTLRDRNMSIMKDSKKKKSIIKALEKDKRDLNSELTNIRVANGILEQDLSVLKIENAKSKTYITELENGITAEATDDVVIEDNPAINLMNREQNRHVCNACDRTFKTSQDLDRHMEAKHSLAKCAFCEDEFTSQGLLKKHIDNCLEYGNTTVKCTKCQETFTRFGMKRHGDICHEKKNISLYSCPECGKRAKPANEIKQHQINDHHEDIEVSKEVCKHWRKGHCFKGNRCQYSHVGFQRKETEVTSQKSTTKTWTASCKNGDNCLWQEKGTCRYYHRGVGVQRPTVNQQSQQSQDSRKLCHFNQRCYKKSTCPFKHTSDRNFPPQKRQQRPPFQTQRNGRSNQ